MLLTVHDITISEPHYLLFYSADCKYTAAIRQRLEMPHTIPNAKYNKEKLLLTTLEVFMESQRMTAFINKIRLLKISGLSNNKEG